MKKLLLAIIISSIHYSSSGNYLVNQDGIRVTIQGHPHMVCYEGPDEIIGTFQKARGSVIYLRGYDTVDKSKTLHYFLIPKPVCDLK